MGIIVKCHDECKYYCLIIACKSLRVDVSIVSNICLIRFTDIVISVSY